VAFGSDGGDGRQHDRVEYVQFGSPRKQGRGWLSRLLLICLLIAAVVIVSSRSFQHRASAPQQPSPTPLPPVRVLQVGHPLLGVTAGWELFGLNQSDIVAIQPARGRIIATALPPPEGGGPVSFIVGPRAAIIRPLDNVPGYLVPDGHQARPLTGALAAGNLLLPGPQPTQEWLVGGNTSTLSLVSADGRPTSVHITLRAPQWAVQSAMSDGRGGILVSSKTGTQYDATPSSLRPVGAILAAVGPKSWLGISCRPSAGCRNIVIDPATGARRFLPGPALQLLTAPWPYEPGAVAPNGSAAAVVVSSGIDRVALELINLSSGATTRIPVRVNQDSSSQTLVWSPDSQWLFAIAGNGKLFAVSARSHRVQNLGVPLPDFSQLAIRAASG
jgi:hypothetical protein